LADTKHETVACSLQLSGTVPSGLTQLTCTLPGWKPYTTVRSYLFPYPFFICVYVRRSENKFT